MTRKLMLNERLMCHDIAPMNVPYALLPKVLLW